ncbi:MAG: SIR2 family protein [Candidatus Thiodiazotropha sp. 6PLUC9]
MVRALDLQQIIDPPEEVIDAAADGDLVMFVGAGTSMLVDLPSWGSFASQALDDLRQAKLLNYSEIEQLKTLDPRKQLSIARIIAEDNGQSLDLAKFFVGKKDGGSIYKALNAIGCTCVTTNYDELLAPQYKKTGDSSAVPTTGARVSDKGDILPNLLDKPGTVIHIHGAAGNPATMIVTTQDYLLHYDDPNVQEFLSELFTKKTVVFIGYGLEEAEILEHILRRGGATERSDRRRFAIQGYFRSQEPLYQKLHRYYEKSFGVELLGFLRDHRDYHCQIGIIEHWSRTLQVREPTLASDAELLAEVFPDG